ncbi:MAG: hypothetical protein R3F04_14925 [Lysobacteraceae bacterium]
MRAPFFASLATGLLLSAATQAQVVPANDVGMSVAPSTFSFSSLPEPQGPGATCPTGPVAGSFTGTNVQLGRIFRDGVASTCPGKAYPGIFNATTTYNYESYTYTNTSSAAACVTVNFDPDTVGTTPCATNAHASAYIGSYDPADQAANFVGDVGSSVAQPFEFEVPAGQNMVLVVSNTSAAAVCDFGFEVVNLPCSALPAPVPQPDVIPSNSNWGLGLLALVLGAVGFLMVRSRH